jgi:peroxiredoxin
VLIAGLLSACGGSDETSRYGIIDWPDGAGDVGGQPGDRAPNFRLENAAGGEIVLSDEVGSPILLNFFASWCTNCREEMAALDAVAGPDVTVIGIDYQEKAETVLELAEETGSSFPMALDSRGQVSREYRATALPVTLLIDQQGVIVDVVRGPVDGERLQEMLANVAPDGKQGG